MIGRAAGLEVSRPERLRHALRKGSGGALRRRRAIVAISVAGTATMAAVTLFQTGILRRLPELPIDNFNSSKVTSSDASFSHPAPDGTIGLAAHAANIFLASMGGSDRARDKPWVPLLAAALGGAEAAVAARNLLRMPKSGTWCSWCIVDALICFGSFALMIPEAAIAAGQLGRTVATGLGGRKAPRAGSL